MVPIGVCNTQSFPTIEGLEVDMASLQVKVDGIEESGKLTFCLEADVTMTCDKLGQGVYNQEVVYKHLSRKQNGKMGHYHLADNPWLNWDTDDALQTLASWVLRVTLRLTTTGEEGKLRGHLTIEGIPSDFRIHHLWVDGFSVKNLSPQAERTKLEASLF